MPEDHRHCEERSDVAIQRNVKFAGFLDCFTDVRNDENRVLTQSGAKRGNPGTIMSDFLDCHVATLLAIELCRNYLCGFKIVGSSGILKPLIRYFDTTLITVFGY